MYGIAFSQSLLQQLHIEVQSLNAMRNIVMLHKRCRDRPMADR